MINFKKDKYYATIKSSEGDYDDCGEEIVEFNTIEEVKFVSALLKLFLSGSSNYECYGNASRDESFPHANLLYSLKDVVLKLPNIGKAIQNKYLSKVYNFDYETVIFFYEAHDHLEESVSDFLVNFIESFVCNYLGSSEYYYTRVFEGIRDIILIEEPLKYKKIKLENKV